MAITTFRRYIWLLETLDRLGYAEFDEIQTEWARSAINAELEDLPKPTFRNHINAIAEQMNLYIAYQAGGGYYIANSEDLKESRIKQ